MNKEQTDDREEKTPDNNGKIKNYVFDLYGTLLDIRTDERAAKTWKRWIKILDGRGIKHPPYYEFRKDFFNFDREHRIRLKAQSGCDCPEIDIINVYRELFIAYGNGVLNDVLLSELSYAFRKSSMIYMRLFPGVEDYLRQLKASGSNVYILSNAQRSYTWPEIVMFDLDKLTDDQLISSDFGCMKPDKRFFDALINKYDLDRNETLMHGDSYSSDIEGAMSAGIKYVHLIGENDPKHYYTDRLIR